MPKSQAAALLLFQNGPLDSAAIYDARCGLGDYSPLFNPLTYQPHKAYWAFVAFNELRKRGTAIEVETGETSLVAAAACDDDGSLAVMVANDSDETVPFALSIDGEALSPTGPICRITDADRTDAEIPPPAELPPRSFLLMLWQ